MSKSSLLSVVLATALVACGDDTDTTDMMDGMMDGMTSDSGDPSGATTFRVRIEHTGGEFANNTAGVFNTPDGATEPGGIGPGSSYTWQINAAPGDRLSFAAMFVESNDWFFAPLEDGMALFDVDGNPIVGDRSSEVYLWDAGVEVDQEPGTGADQPMRQAGPNTGDADPDDTVRMVTPSGGVPGLDELVALNVTHLGEDMFEIVLSNPGAADTLGTSQGDIAAPIAPGVWAVHSSGNPIFTEGSVDVGAGLEALAEDGSPDELYTSVAAETGLTTPFAPGVAIVTTDAGLFASGSPDNGDGLEALAEDGDPAPLAGATDGVVFNTPVDATEAGPLLPGAAYEFEIDALPGYSLSFATMLVQSNDLFVGTSGLALFDGDTPISGDITADLGLYDAGTEVNQHPATGVDQPLRQAGPNTGATDEDTNVRLVDDGFEWPEVSDMLTVTVEVL